jgi:hypothetical protein
LKKVIRVPLDNVPENDIDEKAYKDEELSRKKERSMAMK